jgi:hypothetical protein
MGQKSSGLRNPGDTIKMNTGVFETMLLQATKCRNTGGRISGRKFDGAKILCAAQPREYYINEPRGMRRIKLYRTEHTECTEKLNEFLPKIICFQKAPLPYALCPTPKATQTSLPSPTHIPVHQTTFSRWHPSFCLPRSRPGKGQVQNP